MAKMMAGWAAGASGPNAVKDLSVGDQVEHKAAWLTDKLGVGYVRSFHAGDSLDDVIVAVTWGGEVTLRHRYESLRRAQRTYNVRATFTVKVKADNAEQAISKVMSGLHEQWQWDAELVHGSGRINIDGAPTAVQTF